MKTHDNTTIPRMNARARPKNCLAKAVYDNIAESPDELAFRKGDVLTVLEQNTNGLEGWWLCSLRGRQGICPGNRLRLLAGMYDTGGESGGGQFSSQFNTQLTKRRSGFTNPNKVVTPHKIGDVYVYDYPAKAGEEYDIPPTRIIPVSGSQNLNSRFSNVQSTDGVRTGMAYDIPRSCNITSSPSQGSSHTLDGNICSGVEAYDIPKPVGYPGKSPDPIPCDYDIPKHQGHEYDVPESDNMTYNVPSSHHITVADAYDVPPVHTVIPSNRSSGVSMLSTGSSVISPSSSACSLTPSLSLSSLGGTGSNRSSLEQQHELYDIPPSDPRKVITDNATPLDLSGETYENVANVAEFYDTPKMNQLFPARKTEGVYDVPPQVTKDVTNQFNKSVDESDGKSRLSTLSIDSKESITQIFQGKELPLELDAAMDTLIRVQQEVLTAISKLFGFVSSSWRRKENLENKIYDIKLSCVRIRNSLQEFLDFAQGALVNSTRASDRSLCQKLAKLVKPLQDSNIIIQKTSQLLDEQGWSINKLTGGLHSNTPDELDQLVACARGLTEDVRQVASFIQGNSTLIFKRSQVFSSLPKQSSNKPGMVQERPLPAPPKLKAGTGKEKEENVYENDTKDWIDDYDYVNLESKESVEKENEEIKAALPKELRKSFENILKESQIQVDNDMNSYPLKLSGVSNLDPNDRQVLQFYSSQIDTHITYLTNAIDAFLATIENNQPPKVFIGHSKFVVLSAHKLIYIGDTVHRNIVNNDVRNKVMLCANSLCDALKTTVQCTKTAALQFPSVIAVQEMIDSVVDISHSANDLKLIILQAAKL